MPFLHNTTTNLQDCFGQNKPQRLLSLTKSDINPATGKAYAINPSSGVWDDEYWAQNESRFTGGASGGGSYEDIIKKTIQMQQEANKPAIQSLEAGIPEIQNTFQTARTQTEGQLKPLEDRYKNLLDSIKGNQTTAENRQTVGTRNELGRRGLVGGGLYDQTLTDAVNPITQQYTGLAKDTGIAQEQGIQSINKLLADLAGQETGATRDVRNQIAQLQSGAASTGIQQGIGQYQFNANQALQKQQMEEQARQQAIQNALAQAQQQFGQQQYSQVTLPESLLQQQSLKKQLAKVTGGAASGW